MGRERRILIATALVAIGVPAALASWVRARTDALADTLSAAGGLPVTIGRIDAGLTGAIRLSDVAFGQLIQAESIEASVAMSSLVGGHLRADEIRVSGPRLALTVDADGDSDLARLARRLAAHGRRASGEPGSRIRRIVVARGTLTAHIAGVGELTASDVELVPDAGGARLVTGATRLRGTLARIPARPGAPPDTALAGSAARPGDAPDTALVIDLAFARTAAEIALPQMKFRRVLAVGGAGTVAAAGRPDSETLLLGNVAAGRRDPDGALEIRATVEDGGTPRRIEVDLAPADLAITLRGDRVPLRAFAAIAPRGIGLERARGSGEVVLRRTTSGLQVTSAGRVEGLVLSHPALAPASIVVDAALGGELAITADAYTIPRASFEMGALRLAGHGWVRRGAPLSGLVDLEVAAASCEALLAALPVEVRGPLDGLTVQGDFGVRARLAVDLAAPEGDGATLTTALAGSGCTVLAEPPAADVTTLAERRPDEDAERWVKLKSLPEHVAGAFVSAEDGRFWKHGGFDLEQIARSIEIDLREQRLARGGSTISQQLIKNAFLTQRRSLDRKLQEAILTWRLEARVTKRQILERYLNIIELGPRVFGIREAARYWFDTTPGDLEPRQAAFLAALTSQPTAMSRRVRKAGGLDAESAERVAVVLRAMRRDGVISTAAYDDAKTAGLDFATTAVVAER